MNDGCKCEKKKKFILLAQGHDNFWHKWNEYKCGQYHQIVTSIETTPIGKYRWTKAELEGIKIKKGPS